MEKLTWLPLIYCFRHFCHVNFQVVIFVDILLLRSFPMKFYSFFRFPPLFLCYLLKRIVFFILISGVKRLMREAAELSTPTADYFAAPLEVILLAAF